MGDWWGEQALNEFLKRAQCVVDAYSNYTVHGVHLAGGNEIGENIADFGGVKFAYRALVEHMREADNRGKTFPTPPHGMSPEQLYFVSYGQTWCTKSDPEYLENLIAHDEHSPPKARVNEPLSN